MAKRVPLAPATETPAATVPVGIGRAPTDRVGGMIGGARAVGPIGAAANVQVAVAARAVSEPPEPGGAIAKCSNLQEREASGLAWGFFRYWACH